MATKPGLVAHERRRVFGKNALESCWTSFRRKTKGNELQLPSPYRWETMWCRPRRGGPAFTAREATVKILLVPAGFPRRSAMQSASLRGLNDSKFLRFTIKLSSGCLALQIFSLRPCAPCGHRQGVWNRRLARLRRLSPLSRPLRRASAGW